MRSPRIVTHLFADGGRIIKTIRTDYSKHLEGADVPNVVRQMMKAQHKAMFSALRAGELDELLEDACGPLPRPPSDDSGTHPIARGPAQIEIRGVQKSQPVGQAVERESMPAEGSPSGSRNPRVASVSSLDLAERPTLSRPASRYGSAPSKTAKSIFGEGVSSEKSLDEVILSYIADDLDGSAD